MTRAGVTLAKNRATLEQQGKQLRAKIQSPAEAEFSVISADPPMDDFNAANPDTRILLLKVRAPDSGGIELEVKFQPGTDERTKPSPSIF